MLINASISLISIVFIFLLAEFILFRLVLKPSDLPKTEFVNGILKYAPRQQGIFRVGNSVKATFKINADGWNSSHDQYLKNVAPDKYLIAIVGDSFVEGFHVDFDENLTEDLEANLGEEDFQIYRFGISAAPMSQYLHILRQEVVQYQPDLIIIILSYNDFRDSYLFVPSVYSDAFLKLELDESGNVVRELPPTGLDKKWYAQIRNHSAIWRYLAYRQKVRFGFLRNIILGGSEVLKQAEQTPTNDPVATIEDESYRFTNIYVGPHDSTVTDYLFERMKLFSDSQGAELLIAIDGDRKAIYRNFDEGNAYESEFVPLLNVIAKRAAKRNGVHFIDLHPIFENDFAVAQKRFEFADDGHWNAYAHKLISNAIYRYIKESRLLPVQPGVPPPGSE